MIKTYEQWLAEVKQDDALCKPEHRRGDWCETIDEVERLAHEVSRHSDQGSIAEDLAQDVDGLVAELRSRRAADLTAEDIEALRLLRQSVVDECEESTASCVHIAGRAKLAVLDKLLSQHRTRGGEG